MYMINKKAAAQLVREMSDQLRQTPGFEGYDQTSIQLNTIIQMAASKIADLYDAYDTNNDQQFLSRCSGFYLDAIWGDRLGVPRSSVSYGQVSCAQQALIMSAGTGTLFGQLRNPPASYATLAPGVALTSSVPGVSGRTNQYVSFLPTDTQVGLSATFDQSGDQLVTLAPGSVSGIKLTAFKDQNGLPMFKDNADITVTNVTQILIGSTVEDDVSYRSRLALAWVGGSGFNDNTARTVALAYPDVRDVIVRRWTQGSGSCDVMLIPSADTVSSSTLEQVTAQLEAKVPYSTRLRVSQPNYVFLSAKLRSTMGQRAVVALQQVVGGLMPGSTLGQQAAEQQIRSSLGEPTFRILELRRDGRAVVGGRLTLADDQMFRLPTLDVQLL